MEEHIVELRLTIHDSLSARNNRTYPIKPADYAQRLFSTPGEDAANQLEMSRFQGKPIIWDIFARTWDKTLPEPVKRESVQVGLTEEVIRLLDCGIGLAPSTTPRPPEMLYCVAGAMNHSSGGAKLAAWMEENLGDVVEAVRKTSIIIGCKILSLSAGKPDEHAQAKSIALMAALTRVRRLVDVVGDEDVTEPEQCSLDGVDSLNPARKRYRRDGDADTRSTKRRHAD